jgi:N-acetylneuraminic acid mutarotase
LLPNEQVLVAGGVSSMGVLATAALYNPATGVWTPTGSMGAAREEHTATLLLNGQVLVAGGNEDPGSAELYDPASGSWTRTNNLSPSRARHTATLLPNGQVLVAGGQALSRYGILSRAQLYKSAPEGLNIP